ncbi:MAG: hypothetical protein HKN29_11275 [Rhodothermales bacterium]|nr:hypothetical protein [Rhodothermales bacterium]
MSNSLPTNRDRELATAIGRAGRLPEDDAGEVVEALRELQAAHAQMPLDERAGARMWGNVERRIRAGADRPALRRVTPMRLVWGTVSVAAAVLILILVPRLVAPTSGQLVAQAESESAEYLAGDGSTVLLRPGSSLYRLSEDTFRLEGEGFFDVTSRPERVFAVETVNGVVEVLGTRFVVTSRESRTRVYLEEGSVRFSSGEGQLLLEPGQAVESLAGVIGPVESTTGREDLDWTRGEVFFQSRSAGMVAEELGWHFGLSLELSEEVRTETVSGTLILEDRDQALQDFALVLGGRFVESGDALRFIRD